MSVLINIDTSTDAASVCITKNGQCIAIIKNDNQKEHAGFIHTAVANVLREANVKLSDVDAFAVSSGPGSYTGLRVGMATAKGFCYALSKPLITIGTLEAMAKAAIISNEEKEIQFFCPMIDARRMEVFTAVYDSNINEMMPPAALILEEETFNSFTTTGKIVFFGTGSLKYKLLQKATNAVFANISFSAEHVGLLADKAFKVEKFANLSYSQPEYLKEFYTVPKK